MQGKQGCIVGFCCGWHIKRQLPASTPPLAASLSSIQIFPNFELAISSPHWRSGHNGAFHGGNSLHYTVGRGGGQGGEIGDAKGNNADQYWALAWPLSALPSDHPQNIFSALIVSYYGSAFLAIFLKLAQIICPPPHLSLSPWLWAQ